MDKYISPSSHGRAELKNFGGSFGREQGFYDSCARYVARSQQECFGGSGRGEKIGQCVLMPTTKVDRGWKSYVGGAKSHRSGGSRWRDRWFGEVVCSLYLNRGNDVSTALFSFRYHISGCNYHGGTLFDIMTAVRGSDGRNVSDLRGCCHALAWKAADFYGKCHRSWHFHGKCHGCGHGTCRGSARVTVRRTNHGNSRTSAETTV